MSKTSRHRSGSLMKSFQMGKSRLKLFISQAHFHILQGSPF